MSKPLEWVGSSYKDLIALPEDVQEHLRLCIGFSAARAEA